MIKCLKYTPINKGCLLGFCDILIEKWELEIRGCSLYMKDGKRWINFPSREFENTEGNKAFSPIIKFHNKDVMEKLTEMIKNSIEEYCKANPKETECGPSVFEEENVPF